MRNVELLVLWGFLLGRAASRRLRLGQLLSPRASRLLEALGLAASRFRRGSSASCVWVRARHSRRYWFLKLSADLRLLFVAGSQILLNQAKLRSRA